MRKIVLNFIGAIVFLILVFWIGFRGFNGQAYFAMHASPSLAYLSQPGSGEARLMLTNLEGREEVLLEGVGSLLEMKVSTDGKWLALITEARGNGQSVQLFSIKKGEVLHSYPCGSASCNALFWQADSQIVYFHQAAHPEPGAREFQHRIYAMGVKDGQATPLSFKEGIQPLSFSLSPDGRYQAVYDAGKRGYYILKDQDVELLLILSEDPAAVIWQQHPTRLVVITSEQMVKIPVTHLIEVNLETLVRRYVLDPDTEHMDYSNLIYDERQDTLIFGCRPVLRTLSRQICIAAQQDFVVEQLTDLQSRNHTGIVLSPDGNWLAYQTLDLTASTSKPQVWLLDRQAGRSILLAENAAMPQWIP
jgi:hypothetical protein